MSHLYRVKPSKRAKRLALRLDPIERVFDLVVPLRCSMTKAYDFADQYEDWMAERLNALLPVVQFCDGAEFPLNGQTIKIKVTLDKNRKNTSISLNKNNILNVITNKEDPGVRIIRWIKTYTKDVIKQKSEEKAASICRKIESVSIRDTKSRWGSCSCDGNLSYSWRLIFAPPEAIDYVVAHEVAHLVHLNHSKSFWNLCRELSDDFVTGQYWMRNHGQELMRYGGSTPCE